MSSHCPVEKYVGRYEIMEKLGRGRFSTVYSARRHEKEYAIKVYRSGEDNLDYYRNEIRIINLFKNYKRYMQDAEDFIIAYECTFIHIANIDKIPDIYPCIVFKRESHSLSTLLKNCEGGMDRLVVQKIMREVFKGLFYLHDAGIIHTDIKPSNILASGEGADFTVCIGDLGSATPVRDIFTTKIGTVEYCAPESIIGGDFSFPVDIWAAFITCFELYTGETLFDVFGEHDIKYGDDVGAAVDEHLSEMNVDVSGSDSSSSGSTYTSSSESDNTTANMHHLVLIEKVLGPAPRSFAELAEDYYDRRGKLKDSPIKSVIGLEQLIAQNYNIEDAEQFAQFMYTGLAWLPEDRITSYQVAKQPWLNNNNLTCI